MAQVDYFLEVDGIQGESQDDKHKNQIEVHGFQWGSANKSHSGSGGGGGAGKVRVHDLIISKYLDKSSPKLMEACTTGNHISKATLYCRKAGGGQQEYLKITLTDVLVSGHYIQGGGATTPDNWDGRGITVNGQGSDSNTPDVGSIADTMDDGGELPIPVEMITLNCGKIEYEYREQDNKGNMAGPVKSGWDIKANKLV